MTQIFHNGLLIHCDDRKNYFEAMSTSIMNYWCMEQSHRTITWISNAKFHGLFCVQWFKVRGVCGHFFEDAIHFFLDCLLYQHLITSLFNCLRIEYFIVQINT